MAAQPRSAIGMALNSQFTAPGISADRTRDHHLSRDNLTVVSTDALKRAMLLTPPNSISPNLPPQHDHSARDRSNGDHQESDVDLHDSPGNALTAEALDSLGDLDSAGVINHNMLAKHHLPDILLTHGPLAIRHIMSYLNGTVPGFSRISSAKARRLIVAALESRSNEAGIPEGEVVFEKVGWGRWDARRGVGQPRHAMTPPASLPIGFRDATFTRRTHPAFGSSVTEHSDPYTASDEDHDMYENEADKMSLDGDGDGYQSSEAPPEDPMLDFVEGDETDEEDWGSIGAEALRARSLPASSLPKGAVGRIYQPMYTYGHTQPHTHVAQSVPAKAIPIAHRSTNNCYSSTNDAQARAAAETLLNLGSM